ncbi:allatostatin-A receptor-like protein [Dinothrombium tinctorium]|uniref:Allatostatin-A receptor-like protein n=1 Tax=Dinothrombium tinctorium TaxID=1965070 RepID=A0A3S3NSF8_9ACAR|nr:allatostatin-A receptor-like protein [Dinothrombium tinctorium]
MSYYNLGKDIVLGEDVDHFDPVLENEEHYQMAMGELQAQNISEQQCNNSASNCTLFEDMMYDFAMIEKYISVVVPIFFGIIVIVGLIGNALVVIVVLCNPQMRSTTNLLIINLAIADLLFIVVCVPFTAWDYALSYWPFGEVCCRIVQYFIHVCAYASIYTLVLMSLDRFLAVVHPIASMSIRTEKNAYWAIGTTWITVLVLCIPTLITYNIFIDERENGQLYFYCTFNSTDFNHGLFQLCFFISSYVVPLALAFILYMLMLKRLWFGVVPGGQMSTESVRCKKRVTRLVVVVVVIFAVCWMPIQVVLVLKSFNAYPMRSSNIVIQIVAHVLAYTNSCVNPILYAFLSENFRKAFRKVIACNNNNSSSSNRQQTFTRNEVERTGAEITTATQTKLTRLTNGNV